MHSLPSLLFWQTPHYMTMFVVLTVDIMRAGTDAFVLVKHVTFLSRAAEPLPHGGRMVLIFVLYMRIC